MKFPRAMVLVVLGFFVVSNISMFGSYAATAQITVKQLSLISKVDSTETPLGMLVKRKNIYLFGTISGFANTDGFVQGLDENGVEKWKVALDSGGDDVITSGTVDPSGNIWIAGSSAAPPTGAEPTPSPSSTVLNPDSVTVVSELPTRSDPTILTTWVISPAGNLLATYSVDLKRAIFVKAISVTSSAVSIAGDVSTTMGSAGFLIQSDLHGVFGKIIIIGKSDTEINAIAKNGKNLLIVGSSSENLYSKKVSGLRDGIIATYSSSAKFLNVVRSFNTLTSREWRFATATNFLGGSAQTGSKSEAVVTKYSSTMAPTWTVRFPAEGSAQTVDISSTIHFAVFASTGAIAGIKTWKPTKAQIIAVIFDSKGLISGAFRAASMTKVISSGFTPDLGVVILARGPLGVSIFHSPTL